MKLYPLKSSTGGIIDTNYHHHSVLSDNINGTWGTSVIDNTVSEDSVVYKDFSYELPDLLLTLLIILKTCPHNYLCM